MNYLETIECRHTVRKYLDKPIEDNKKQIILDEIRRINDINQLSFDLITDQSNALDLVGKLMFSNVNNYIVLAANESVNNYRERIGYYSAELMLLIQSLGLNTCWIGGTFNKAIKKKYPDLDVRGILVIGYGETQGKPHKSKRAEDVYLYKGEAPQWFLNGVQAALKAPTAMNKQDFIIYGAEKEVAINCYASDYSEENLGIVKYFFEIGAGKENLENLNSKTNFYTFW